MSDDGRPGNTIRLSHDGERKRALPDDAVHFARELRKSMTQPEQLLWALLRDRRLLGFKFRRQHPLLPYTLDFYCHELRVAVELDGGQHLGSESDARRDSYLEQLGVQTLRYWNHDLLHRTEAVLEDLWQRLSLRAQASLIRPCGPPSPGGRR